MSHSPDEKPCRTEGSGSSGRGEAKPLRRMFAGVPDRYDLVNRLFTLRFDERWRSLAAREILRHSPTRVLDAGSGTGDLVLHLARQLPVQTEIIGADFSEPMLSVAMKKVSRAGFRGRIGLVCTDVSNLCFPDDHFDIVSLAFAFRNLVWRNPIAEKCLAEMVRVLRPGGKIVIVESSQPGSGFLKFWYHAYLKMVVPRLGDFLSGESGAYRYLSESARLFLNPEEVEALLAKSGFKGIRHRSLLGGVAALHVGEK